MATLAERMDTVEDRLDRTERLAQLNQEFLIRFSERVDRYIAQATRDREEDRKEAARYREEAARYREEDRKEAARYREEDRKEAARYREEAAQERREMNKRWGELANKMGTIVEDIVAPSVRRMAREQFDCGDERLFTSRIARVRSDDSSLRREFDVLYVGTRAVLLNETKSSPRNADAQEFADFLQRGEFFLYFPEYRGLSLVPVFSSLSLPDDMVTYLTRNHIYALAMGDEAMQVLNLEAVRGRLAGRQPSR